MDGVLADFTAAFREKAGLPLDYQPSDWDWSNSGLSKEQIDAVWAKIVATPNFWLNNLLPLPGTTRLSRLGELVYEPYFITSRVETSGWPVQIQTQEWLKNKGVLCPNVIVSKDPSRKAGILRALDIEFFIDDKWETCVQAATLRNGPRVFLQDASHNRSQSTEGFERVESFDKFMEAVDAATATR